MTPMGDVTVPHLHRMWSRACREKPGQSPLDPVEAAADKIAIYGLGLGLYETLQFLHARRPGFDAFLDWILARNGGAVEPARIAWVNDRIGRLANDKSPRIAEPAPVEPGLGADDLAFWDENGYVVLREAVPREAALAAQRAVWDFTGARPDDPDTWYRNADGHTIMVPLVHHPAFDANRRSPRIRAAYAQLLGTNDLVVTVDRGGFNRADPAQHPGHPLSRGHPGASGRILLRAGLSSADRIVAGRPSARHQSAPRDPEEPRRRDRRPGGRHGALERLASARGQPQPRQLSAHRAVHRDVPGGQRRAPAVDLNAKRRR
jgi:hypothetical protein